MCGRKELVEKSKLLKKYVFVILASIKKKKKKWLSIYNLTPLLEQAESCFVLYLAIITFERTQNR